MNASNSESQTDPSRRGSPESVNQEIDRHTRQNLQEYAHPLNVQKISSRLKELDQEWDVDRALMANASTLSLAGVLLGATVNRKWFIMPGIVNSFLLWHAIQGWCPPLPLFRKLGYRSRKEIDAEKYALKALRGDFADLKKAGDQPDVEKAWQAAKS